MNKRNGKIDDATLEMFDNFNKMFQKSYAQIPPDLQDTTRYEKFEEGSTKEGPHNKNSTKFTRLELSESKSENKTLSRTFSFMKQKVKKNQTTPMIQPLLKE